MKPIIRPPGTPEALARWGIRGIEDWTIEVLTRLQPNVDGWSCQRAPYPERTRCRQWLVMKPKTANPA
jgi:hypothetical protein